MLSRRSTLINKYIYPAVLLLVVLFAVGYCIVNFGITRLFSSDIIFYLFLTWIAIHHFRFQQVEYNSEELFVSNYFNEKIFPLKDVIKIKRSFFSVYIILIRVGGEIKKVRFFPSQRRLFVSRYEKSQAVIQFEKAVQNLKETDDQKVENL
ncbi:MAG: hypothetical protein JWN78_2715 [Bacteroidota bacterium]|nr:hypothetical protein [Bacteroidota bacterium]